MGAGGVPQQPDPPASCQAQGPAEGGRMWALLARGGSWGCPRGGQRAPRGRRETEQRGREFSTADPGGRGQMWRGGESPLPAGLGARGLGWEGLSLVPWVLHQVPDWQGQLNLGPGVTLGGSASLHQTGP